MKSGSNQAIISNKTLIVLTIILILNTALAGLNFNILYMQSTEQENQEEAPVSDQFMAEDLLEYSRNLSEELGVQDRASVKEALANFSYEIDLAKDSGEMAGLIFTYSRQLQETILKEWDALLREKILAVINRDKNLKEETGKIQFTLSITNTDGDEVIADPPVLHDDTLKEILVFAGKRHGHRKGFPYRSGGKLPSLILCPIILGLCPALTEELTHEVNAHEIRVALGLRKWPARGGNQIIRCSGRLRAGDIIHDSDVRDVVNELFVAGAKGVAVGGLTADSLLYSLCGTGYQS